MMPPLYSPPCRRLGCHSGHVVRLAAVLALGALACEEDKAPTAPPAPVALSVASASAADGITPLGTIPLPVDQIFSGPELAFGITQTGSGRAGLFKISNTGSASNALDAVTNAADTSSAALSARSNGFAGAGRFLVNNAGSTTGAFQATTIGTGSAGAFRINNAGSTASALEVTTDGIGSAFQAATSGRGSAGSFQVGNPNSIATALSVVNAGRGMAGTFKSTTNYALRAENGSGTALVARTGSGTAGGFTSTGRSPTVSVSMGGTASTGSALEATTAGTGFAGVFNGTYWGVKITTKPGGTGLQVVGGTKKAVVGTLTGARSLYSEEATEVWFADYGFGKLENGRVRILIDPDFAQTVSLEEPYHVFLQPYGRAELYVEGRTSLGFVVRVKDGDPNVEFGYRVVAKRSGFETERLERAPWADNSPGLEASGRE